MIGTQRRGPAGLSTGPAGQPPAMSDDRDDCPAPEHLPPADVDEPTIEAVGKLTEALESTERARGHLYAFHQLTGKADFEVGDAERMLREAGHAGLADRLREELVGRNVLHGRWTFQVVEEYDHGYWQVFRALEQEVRDALVGGRRHLYEAGLKEERRTHGDEAHRARPRPEH